MVVLAAAVLFVCYWRQSLTQPISSDGAANALQAWDMLHGNLLLHGWLLSDVSFYTTELPQYMVIEAIRGLGPEVVNLAAAMTYTLLVLLAGLLAKGDAGGREGLARFLLAAGIVLAPQLSATSTLLQAPDHTGTAVALLVVWLVIDRARPHWLVPVAVCVMLAWIMAADSIVLLTGIVPIAVAAGARAVRALAKRAEPSWHELSLAAAAILAAVLGAILPAIIRAAGGYTVAPVPRQIVGIGRLPGAARVAFHAALNIFGANVVAAHSALEVAFAVLHLAGAALAAWAVCLAALRFFRARELLVPALAVAIVVNLAAFVLTAQTLAATREIAAVLPLGAVLAGRLLAGRLLAWRLLAPGRRWDGEGAPGTAEGGAGGGRGGVPGGARVRCGAARRARHERAAGDLAGRPRVYPRAGRLLAGRQHHARRRRPGQPELGRARPRRPGGPGSLGDQHAAVRPVPAVRRLRRRQGLRDVLHPVASGRRGTNLRPASAHLRRGAVHDHDLARQPAGAAREAPHVKLSRSASPRSGTGPGRRPGRGRPAAR